MRSYTVPEFNAVYNKNYAILEYPLANSANLYIKRAADNSRSKVFGSQEKSVSIYTPAELNDKMRKYSTEIFVLENDIDVSALTYDVNASFNVTFTGRFLGTGHKFTDLQKPLFQAIKYAFVEDLILKGTGIVIVGIITPSDTYSNLK